MGIVARFTRMFVPRAGIVLLGLVALGCKTRGDDEPDSLQSSGAAAAAAPVCIKPMVVNFRAAPAGFGLAGGATSDAAPIKIQLTPKDLEKAESVSCKDPLNCTAVVAKPIDFSVSVPMPMIARIKLDFQQTMNGEGAFCMRKVKMGTSLDYKPACFGKILNASVDVGVNLSEQRNGFAPPTYNAEPYLKANLTYSTPFFSVGAHANSSGLLFDSTISLKGLTDNALLKEVLPERTVSARVSYEDLSVGMRNLRDAVVKEGAMTADNTDISWEAIDKRCDRSLM